MTANTSRRRPSWKTPNCVDDNKLSVSLRQVRMLWPAGFHRAVVVVVAAAAAAAGKIGRRIYVREFGRHSPP